MAGTAAEFRLALRAAADEVDSTILAVTKKLALEALSRVVYRSPVDTGRFRGNWTVSIESPDPSTSAAFDKDGASTIARGASVVTGMPSPKVIYVQNNLPYAQRLENGWSQQAPAGIVAVTFAELSTTFQV